MRRLIFLVACLGGCLEAEDDLVQFSEDFENGVGLWNQSGEVSIVTTNHPGEHAAWLAPGASIERSIAINRSFDGDGSPYNDGFTDGNWIEYSGDCVGRPALTLEPTTLPAGTNRDLRVRLVLEGPPGPDFAREKLMFPALPSFIVPPDDDEPWNPSDPPDVRFASLVVVGAAPCRIDNLRVMVSGGTIGY